mmetsp:Transcript_33067/g.72517  ORF Transcript_33067/g.72517 Transcript_33067/m.72517 type:complete len:239 (-) Transcript_33067:1225-1941(-)
MRWSFSKGKPSALSSGETSLPSSMGTSTEEKRLPYGSLPEAPAATASSGVSKRSRRSIVPSEGSDDEVQEHCSLSAYDQYFFKTLSLTYSLTAVLKNVGSFASSRSRKTTKDASITPPKTRSMPGDTNPTKDGGLTSFKFRDMPDTATSNIVDRKHGDILLVRRSEPTSTASRRPWSIASRSEAIAPTSSIRNVKVAVSSMSIPGLISTVSFLSDGRIKKVTSHSNSRYSHDNLLCKV